MYFLCMLSPCVSDVCIPNSIDCTVLLLHVFGCQGRVVEWSTRAPRSGRSLVLVRSQRLLRNRSWAICCEPWSTQPSLMRLASRENDVKLVHFTNFAFIRQVCGLSSVKKCIKMRGRECLSKYFSPLYVFGTLFLAQLVPRNSGYDTII